MKLFKLAAIALLSIAALTGCNQSTVDQSKLCIVSTDAQAAKCNAGELMYFSPQFFGNEQLPLNIAAAYCDFNHQVMNTKGGVICVFTDKRLNLQ